MLADLVLPTLDAGDEKIFIKINRPHPSIKYDQMIEGLIEFKNDFKGQFWVEIMIMKDINDTPEALEKIKQKLDLINPDRIDINVPIRPPAESWVKVPDKSVLELIKEVFEDYNDISLPEHGKFNVSTTDLSRELLNIIERHPMHQEQIIETFLSEEISEEYIIQELTRLETENLVLKSIHENKIFWKLKPGD